MKSNNQRGIVHVLLLAILVLLALSILARCDIDDASADEITPFIEQIRDEPNTTTQPENGHEPSNKDRGRRGHHLDRPVDV